jgi:catechol 2,3-dioxygenase-like lactoylglutathione lyase family enzyme
MKPRCPLSRFCSCFDGFIFPEIFTHNDIIILMRNQRIDAITFVVRDYDKAIEFFTQKLQFDLLEDTPMDKVKRWVLVAPRGSMGTNLLLAKADSPEQELAIGNQTGGRVFLFLHTDDFWRDYNEMKSRGVKFAEEPREETYGTVAVFFDLYGNKWDLLERKSIMAE